MSENNIVLKAENINKSFGRKKIIDNVSFELNSGEIFGFLGPNGSGKTTTIKMILGLLEIDSGKISIGGYDREKNFEKALGQIGGIIENPDTYSYLTGYKNIEVFARLRGELDRNRINEVVKLVGLENRIHEKVRTYSLGMKQRLGVAQAIIHHPKVLILDEPTNGLDPSGIRELRDILKHLSHDNGLAVFVSSHILSEMQLLCDRVCIINKGAVLSTKTVDELTDGSSDRYCTFKLKPTDTAYKYIMEHMPDRFRRQDSEIFELNAVNGDVPKVVAQLASAGIEIYSVQPTVKSLEESFMEITGGGNTIA